MKSTPKLICNFRILFFLLLISTNHLSAQEVKKDYTSKVPVVDTEGITSIKDSRLKNNVLNKRFAESRKNQSVNNLRPVYHFISPEGRLNDPNGLTYWQGNWHLFYQAYPPEDTRQHWGHAISEDLIHWKDLPYAIYPNPEDRVYSGATLVEDNRVIAMYHGTNAGTMVATSTDPLLLNWKKTPESPVIKLPKPGEKLPYNVFDPNIWKQDGVYYTVLAGTRPNGPGGKNIRANYLFKSKDLNSWEYMHEFIEGDMYSYVGDDGACPYFFPIGKDGKHIFLHFSHMTGGKYLIGNYDTKRQKFVVTDGGHFNHGPVGFGGVHAPSATLDKDGNVIVLFNMNSGKRISPTNQIEAMTLPRLLSLDANGRLLQSPIYGLESLRDKGKKLTNIKLSENQIIEIPEAKGNVKEIKMSIDVSKCKFLEFRFLADKSGKEFTRLMYYKNGGWPVKDVRGGKGRYSSVALDNSNGSLANDVTPRVAETANVLLENNEKLELQIFIDKSLVEVFVNNKQVISIGTYPTLVESQLFFVQAKGGDAVIESLESYNLKSIY